MNCPIPNARGTQHPVGLGTNGVLLLGEAMGDQEAEAGYGFVESAPAGSVLTRAIRRSGYTRDQFVIWNVCPTQPPKNWLEGAPYEADAIAWGLGLLDDIVRRFQPRVILALGNVALKATTALSGILANRGYAVRSERYCIPVVGALHPAFLRRGAMAYMSVLMHDIRFAVALAGAMSRNPLMPDARAPRNPGADTTPVNPVPDGTPASGVGGFRGCAPATLPVSFWSPVLWRQVEYELPWPLPPLDAPIVPRGYKCYPTEADALDFLREVQSDPTRMLAYDIETPRSSVTQEDETDELDHEDQIISIQFSQAPEMGIFMPWRDPFREIARAALATPNPKLGANNWRFDDGRLRAAGCEVRGDRHDIRWAWKHFQPDLSGGLQFVTSFYAPQLMPWKHLDRSHPQVYGIRDVDVLMRII